MGVFIKSILILMMVFMVSCTEGQRLWLSRFLNVSGSAVPVAVEKMVIQEREIKSVLPAVLAPSEQVDVRLSYEIHVSNVLVNVGDFVNVGSVLCQLSTEDINLRLASIRAELREAQATLEKNQYTMRNKDRLLDEGKIDNVQYDNIDAEVRANEGTVDRLKTQIISMETQAGGLNVTSPIAGIVKAKNVSPGIVMPENQILFTITRIDPISVVFGLAPYEAKSVRYEMPIVIKLREIPGEEIIASITSIGSQINPETGRFDVKANMPNPNNLYKVGMTAQVEFASADKQRFFSLPQDAIITDGRRHYVFTISMGVAHKVPVTIKEIKEGLVEIVEGLVDGDLVVIKGNKQLKEGAVVDVWGR